MQRHPNHRDPDDLPADLRRTSVPAAARAWVEQATGSRIRRVRRLAGASSTAVHGVYLEDGTRVVLRRYVWRDYLANEPEAPGREIDVLRFAEGRDLPIPVLIAADPTGDELGDGIPALLTSFLPGQPVAVPDLARLAEVAASIHDIDADTLGHEYFRWYDGTVTKPPAGSTQPRLWERAIELWHGPEPPTTPRFVHRDFHPGNVLWSRGQASGIVDWVNGCRGPWGCDVAHCRTNLIDWGDGTAADDFLAAYESLTGRTYHPYWEIAAILENEPEWLDENLDWCEPRLAAAVAQLT